MSQALSLRDLSPTGLWSARSEDETESVRVLEKQDLKPCQWVLKPTIVMKDLRAPGRALAGGRMPSHETVEVVCVDFGPSGGSAGRRL